MDICNNCNKEIDSESLFCQFCGYSNVIWTLEEGTLLYHNRYKIKEPIGSGGMATLYLAEDLNLANTPCVIKVMTDEFKDEEEREYAINKFKDEAVMLARLRHNSLPVVQNHFIEEGKYYLVMDYIEGKTLEDILIDTLNEGNFLSEEKVLKWGIQACDALDYLHNYEPMIIHRDIKPENLMENKEGRIILVDFGIAHIFEKRDTRTRIGTTGFAAPEQYMGSACAQSDLFSLGAVLYRLITGKDPAEREKKGNPFSFPPLSSYRNDLSPGLQEVISKSLEFTLEKRYASAKELKKALVNIRKNPSGPLDEIKNSILSSEFKIDTYETAELKEKFSTITGLDTGSYEIKILQLDCNKKGIIYPKLIAGKSPGGIISKGEIKEPEKVSKTIKNLLKSFKGKEIFATLSPYSSFIRTVTIPSIEKEKIPSLLTPKLKELIPVSAENFYIEYNIISSSEETIDVRICAINKRDYEKLQKTLILAGVNHERIAPEPFITALIADLMIKEEKKKEKVIIINIGKEGTSLTIIKDGTLRESFTFSYGGNKFTEAIMSSEKTDFEKAEKLKKNSYNILNNNILKICTEKWIKELEKSLKSLGQDYSIDKFSTVIFAGGGSMLKNFKEYTEKKFAIRSEKFILFPPLKVKDKHKKLILEKSPLLMPAAGLIISSLDKLLEEEKVSSLLNYSIFQNPLTYKTKRLLEIKGYKEKTGKLLLAEKEELAKEDLEELERYIISIIGEAGAPLIEDSLKKLGFTKERLPVNNLDGLMEIFSCQVNLTPHNIENISKKLEELKIAKPGSKKKSFVNIREELEKYLISITGSIGKTVLEDSIKKAGCTGEKLSPEKLDSIIEIFCCQINLAPDDIEKISKKLEELKVIAEKQKDMVPEDDVSEDTDPVEELEKYLISIVGSVGKTVFESSIEKLGYKKDNIPPEGFDSILEMFCCQFNLTPEDTENISKKLENLKVISEKMKNKKIGNKKEKTGFFSSIFKWGK